MVLEESDILDLRTGRLVPTGPLARYVTEISINVRGQNRPEVVGLPHGYVDIIFRIFDDGDGRSAPRRLVGSELRAVGTQTRAFRVPVTNIPVTAIIRFRPGGAFPFFRTPMKHLADRVLPVEEIWGADGRELHERLMEDPDTERWLTLIETSLRARLHNMDSYEPTSTRVVAAATRTIRQLTTAATVGAVADKLGMTSRHLLRIFDEAVGMQPKVFARIGRFRDAWRSADLAVMPDWADIAAGAGYYDQAHLIAECRKLTGMTPSTFLRVWRNAQSGRGPAPSG
jgi:AraC-like DNA-binding protein